MMSMWLRTILLTYLVIAKHLITIFTSHWQHFFNVNVMIYAAFIQNHQWCNAFQTYSQPYHDFLRKLLVAEAGKYDRSIEPCLSIILHQR